MRLITVTALQPQQYDGRAIAVGEVFTVSPIEAASLRYRGRVLLGLSDTPPVKPVRKRRAYKRRDMRVED